MHLNIIYQCNDYVAIDKPSGLLVHRTSLAADALDFALQLLSKQLNRLVYPCHRLDRPTSGVLLFALNRKALIHAQKQFADNLCTKTYSAVVRGWFPAAIDLDYPLRSEEKPDRVQEAQTAFRCEAHKELPFPSGKYATTRISLITAYPKTGRKHQIRRHLAHLRHPILGDTRHGDGHSNRLLRKLCGEQQQLLLRATSLHISLQNEISPTEIKAPPSADWLHALEILKLHQTN